MDAESGQNSCKENTGKNRVETGDFYLGENDLAKRMREAGDSQSESSGERAFLANRRTLFVQRYQCPDHHSDQASDEEMHDLLSEALDLFGMFIDPITGKGFEGIRVTGQIVSDPGWQLHARIRENMVCFVRKCAQGSCIAFEECEHP